MITVHTSSSRGSANLDWLKTKYSFSFADYYNPERVSFGALRALNEDVIAAGKGFGMHPHRDMEIVTIILDGELTHQDSMGNKGTIPAGSVQHMSAGTGVVHAEFNHGKKPVHLLQIWVEPKSHGIKPAYGQKDIALKKNALTLLVSGKKAAHALTMHQDAAFLLGELDKGTSVTHTPITDCTFVFLISGALNVNGKKLAAGDSADITDEKIVKLAAEKDAKVLVIDVPAV
jgi:redox-sensitive bicupin YhaK (pirin superfamily)